MESLHFFFCSFGNNISVFNAYVKGCNICRQWPGAYWNFLGPFSVLSVQENVRKFIEHSSNINIVIVLKHQSNVVSTVIDGVYLKLYSMGV